MLFKRSRLIELSVTGFVLAGLASCGGSSSSPADVVDTDAEDTFSAATLTAVLQTNAEIAFNAYTDSHTTAEALLVAVNTLVATPTEANLTAAKTAWLEAREPYGQTEAYRFRLGPIDSTDGVEEDGPEGQINAWPLAEALIDYVAIESTGTVDGVDEAEQFPPISPMLGDNAIADSINFVTIDKTTIVTLNEADGDESNVATGYHAIEFLLWGQDLYNDPTDTTWTGSDGDDRLLDGGHRPATDYDVSGNCTSGAGSAQADNICTRRGQYLVAATELLIDDLASLVTEWDPAETGNHYDDFVAAGEDSLSIIVESMGRLGFGELAGERMNIALEQDSQEDEHSCFSDNTHRDILLNEQGIANSYFGTYSDTAVFTDATEVSGGTSLDDLLREAGLTTEADALSDAITAAQTAIAVIDTNAATQTFDIQIAPSNTTGNANVRAAIDALVDQTNAIQDVIDALEIVTGDIKGDTDETIE